MWPELGKSQDLTGAGGGGGVRHSLSAKIKEEGRARNLTENLKVTVLWPGRNTVLVWQGILTRRQK